MERFDKKYNYREATHCWFCDREYESNVSFHFLNGKPLGKTKEHIIPKSKLKIQDAELKSKNYVSSCVDCNQLKANRTPRQFAKHIQWLMRYFPDHILKIYLPKMYKRAWKLHNKTSKLQKINTQC